MTTFNEPITYSVLAHLYVARGAVLCLPWWSWPGFGGWYLPEDQSVNRKFALYCRNCEFCDATLTWNSGNQKLWELTDLVFSGQDPLNNAAAAVYDVFGLCCGTVLHKQDRHGLFGTCLQERERVSFRNSQCVWGLPVGGRDCMLHNNGNGDNF